MLQSPSTQKRIPSLDGLRGVSIWAVLFAHIATHFHVGVFRHSFVRMLSSAAGYFGVTVFFVISGFLITRLLLNERERTGAVSLRGFYRRRAVRVLPAFLLFAAVVICFGHPTVVQQFYALSFTTSFAFEQAYRPLQQLWSLSVEEQFYLIWPLLMARNVRTARGACWFVMIACPVIRLLLKLAGYREYSHLGPAILDSIAAGCLLAFYHDEVRNWVRRLLPSGFSFACACLATVCVAAVLYRFDVVLLWGMVPCMLVAVIAAAIERKEPILNVGPLTWSGLLSYSLYLWQQPMLVMDGPLDLAYMRVPLAFLAAWISYRLVEQPALRVFAPAPRKPVTITAPPEAVPET
jgi:peptidoglycan/LPS O-acetylase OafA/YrhL